MSISDDDADAAQAAAESGESPQRNENEVMMQILQHALNLRTNWQDDVDAAQAVAESGESLQRRLAESGESLQEGMLRLLQSTNSVATLSDPMSLAHLMSL